MKYLCLAYGDQRKMSALTKDQFEALVAQCRVHDEELKKSGHYVSAQSLEWASMAIRPRGGKIVTSDGPYAETKEQVGGYLLVDCESLDEAIEVAAQVPIAVTGSVEIRPLDE